MRAHPIWHLCGVKFFVKSSIIGLLASLARSQTKSRILFDRGVDTGKLLFFYCFHVVLMFSERLYKAQHCMLHSDGSSETEREISHCESCEAAWFFDKEFAGVGRRVAVEHRGRKLDGTSLSVSSEPASDEHQGEEPEKTLDKTSCGNQGKLSGRWNFLKKSTLIFSISSFLEDVTSGPAVAPKKPDFPVIGRRILDVFFCGWTPCSRMLRL